MSRIDEKLEAVAAAVEAAEMSADPNAPLPAGTSVTRGHPRARNLQVRQRGFVRGSRSGRGRHDTQGRITSPVGAFGLSGAVSAPPSRFRGRLRRIRP